MALTQYMNLEVWVSTPGGVGLVGPFLGVNTAPIFTHVLGALLSDLGLEIIDFDLESLN